MADACDQYAVHLRELMGAEAALVVVCGRGSSSCWGLDVHPDTADSRRRVATAMRIVADLIDKQPAQQTRCPRCGHGFGPAPLPKGPKVGDYGMCTECGTVLIFCQGTDIGGMELQAATVEEVTRAPEQVVAVARKLQKLRASRGQA